MSELDRRTFIKAAAASTAAVALSRLVKPETVVAATPTRGSVVTNDGVTLRYDEAGSGKPLVCIPGWSQTAAQWKHQVSGLSDRYRVIAVDMRGHGESTKPDHGYTIQRLAKDVQDLLVALNLTDVTVAKLVLVDQMPMITADPAWSPEEKDDAGAIFDPTSLYATIDKLAGPEGAKTTGGFIGAMFTKTYPRDDLAWVVTQNLKMPREYAAALLLNHSSQDWRRLIPRITVPTLVVGGRVSVVPWKSQVWVHNQIRGSRLEIFEENEGGNHFMFMENPEKFNRVVREFIG